MKKWSGSLLILVFLAMAAGIFVFLRGGEEEPIVSLPLEEEKRLVVYSSEREELLDAIIPLFEEKYGIQVHLVQGESGELLERIEEDGRETEADVLMGLSLSDIAGEEGLFQEYVSVNDKYLLEPWRNTGGYATSYVLSGSCLIVNETLAKEYEIEDYEDLLNPALKGKITMADPRTSTTGFLQLLNILEVKGGCESESAWRFVGQLLEQTDGERDNSSEVYESVAKGEYIVGLSQEDAGASLMREGADVRVIYPGEGSLYSPRTAAIVRGSRHLEYARHFVDFITGKDMQDIFGTLLTSRPVRQDAKISQYLQEMDEIQAVTENEEYLMNSKNEIQERYRLLRERLMGME